MSLLGLSTAGHWGGSGSDTIITYNYPLDGNVISNDINGLVTSQELDGVIQETIIEGFID